MFGLSPLSWAHPLRFQPKWVRPSTGSYPRFSLPQDSSPGFASAACDSLAILKARFRCGSFPNLTSPHTATRWLILQKARRHPAKGAPTACRRTVSGTVSLPLGVLFTFPSRYWFAIGHRRVFSLGGWSPGFAPGFTCPALLGILVSGPHGFAYGALTRCGRPFHAVPLPCGFVNRSQVGSTWTRVPQPPCGNACRLHAPGFGLVRVRSPLLAQSRLISFPLGT